MARSSAVRALAPLAMLAAAGCQDYNFNPVGHCLVQPGNERVTLSDLSSADILFVVDDSGSMAAEQQRSSPTNFTRFVDNLDQTNAERAAAGLSPIDFHIAVTTTSVFWNPEFASSFAYTCQAGVCRNSSGAALTGGDGQPVTCSREGSVLADQASTSGVAGCGRIEHTFDFSFCTGQGSPDGDRGGRRGLPAGRLRFLAGEPARPPLRQGAVRLEREEPPGLHAPAAHRLVRGRRDGGRKRHRRHLRLRPGAGAPGRAARGPEGARRAAEGHVHARRAGGVGIPPICRRPTGRGRTRSSCSSSSATRTTAPPPTTRAAGSSCAPIRPAPTPACVTSSRRRRRRRSSSR